MNEKPEPRAPAARGGIRPLSLDADPAHADGPRNRAPVHGDHGAEPLGQRDEGLQSLLRGLLRGGLCQREALRERQLRRRPDAGRRFQPLSGALQRHCRRGQPADQRRLHDPSRRSDPAARKHLRNRADRRELLPVDVERAGFSDPGRQDGHRRRRNLSAATEDSAMTLGRRVGFSIALAWTALFFAQSACADDKDLLKRTTAPPNLLIVFGNSQTTEQPILGSASAWDGEGDSPASKMGAAKRVIRQFVFDKRGYFNVGLTSFSHDPNVGSIGITGKHWLYAPLTTDFPSETWKEPAGTIGRWGNSGEGPCTNLTVPVCTDRSPFYITLGSSSAVAVGPFFGNLGGGTAYLSLNGSASTATQRIKETLVAGSYGDAYTGASLATLSLAGTHSMEVHKEYQEKVSNIWTTTANTPNGNPGTVTIFYAPPSALPVDLFFRSGADAGKEIGFLSDARGDFTVSANCSGWEFQSNSAPLPLVKIPRDYLWGATCSPPQDSYACVTRVLRPQGDLVRYNQATGTFTTADYDNPGYTGSGSKYADGCDPNLL